MKTVGLFTRDLYLGSHRRAHLVSSALLGFAFVSTGCGELLSSGSAPGQRPTKTSDGGIVPASPARDGGACDGVVDAGLPYSAEDSEAFFYAYVYDAVQTCASCHFSGSEPAMNPTNTHQVMRLRIELDAASAAETKAGKYLQLEGAELLDTHPYPFDAKANAKMWIDNHLFGPCAGGTPSKPVVPDAGAPVVDAGVPIDAGLCEDGALDADVVAQLAIGMSNDVYEAFRSPTHCTNCHSGGQSKGGFSYSAANKIDLTQTLLESRRIEAGRSPAATTLGTYLNLGAPQNPVPEASSIHATASGQAGFTTTLRVPVEAFLQAASTELLQVACNPPDAGVVLDAGVRPDGGRLDAGLEDVQLIDVDVVVDAGGGPECSRQSYSDADSRAYFDTYLKAATRTCASCHYATQSPTMNDASAHNVMRAHIESDAVSAAATTAGKVYGVDGASKPGHLFPFSANAVAPAKTWIENHLNGVLPPGCEP